MPSSFAPIRSMALRERTFRASVLRVTRWTSQRSKAWASMRRLASVFTTVRWAPGASQVQPISTACGTPGGRPTSEPGGMTQNSMLP